MKNPCLILLLTFSFLSFSFFVPKEAFAIISSCSSYTNTNEVNINSDNSFPFYTTNNDEASNMAWLKITVPSANFSIGGQSEIEFSIDPNVSGGFYSTTIDISVGGTAASSANWTVQVSDDSGGANPTSCTGNLGTSIVDPDYVSSAISNIVISNINNSSATISWTTGLVSTSLIEYGKTSSYGSTESNSTLKTSHSLTLSSLSSNTTYHYNIKSESTDGIAESGDNTFVTSNTSTVVAPPVTVIRTVTPSPTPTPIPDTTKPNVTVTTDFEKSFDVSPEISGTAKDNKGIQKVEYSLDEGRNWFPVEDAGSLGTRSTSFSFTPYQLEDGNYSIQVRAVDLGGNIGVSKVFTLIIDRLPPQVSGVLYSMGPQVINPRKDGAIEVLSNQSFKITVSEVGGSTKISLIGQNVKDKTTKSFNLSKNSDSSLWSSLVSLDKEGEYDFKIIATDGAGNETKRDLNNIIVAKKGIISDAEKGVSEALISVYYLEPKSKIWQLWDGKPYSQANPQKTDSSGNYSFFLPTGRYYFQIEAPGYQDTETEFFNIDKPQPVNANFSLKSLKLLISLGPIKVYLPDFSVYPVAFKNNLPDMSSGSKSIIGRPAPFFRLTNIDKSQFTIDSLKGKPTVLTFLNTWSPQGAEQVSILNNLSKNKNYSVEAIVEGEKASKVYVFQKRGDYEVSMVPDPDASLIVDYNLSVLPVTFFIDRKGVVKDIITGSLSEIELENTLISISQ